MTFVTFDWEAFKAYAENCHVGTFQVKQVMEGTEIRVRAGRLGYVGVFNLDDPYQRQAYERIRRFCTLQQYVPVEKSVDDDLFHA